MTRDEWVDWFFELEPHEQRESLADMGEQVDLLYNVRILFANCEEFGDDIDFEDLRRAAWGE
jgi:hypothetical protein